MTNDIRNPINREILVRAKARRFATEIKSNPGWATRVPDATFDWLRDSELQPFREWLLAFGLRQRADGLWEEK